MTDAEAPILCSPDAKKWFIERDPDAGKDLRQEEKGTTEDEMIGWHHQLDGQEFEQALRVGNGQGSLVCCSPWGRKELDKTERLNWTDVKNWLIWKDPDGGKTLRQEKKAMIEDEMVGWHHWLNEYEFG